MTASVSKSASHRIIDLLSIDLSKIGFRIPRALFQCVLASLLALICVIGVEWTARGSLSGISEFLTSFSRPGMTTVAVLALIFIVLDATLGRIGQSIFVVAPLLFIPAFMSSQKQHYLSDPLYPSDFLFGRQVMELLPVMVRDRPFTAIAMVIGLLGLVMGLVRAWRWSWRHLPKLSQVNRIVSFALCAPLVAMFFSLMDYSQFSWVRDRLQVVPMMWDQKENYDKNGFILAFAFNLPMAHVKAPVGFSENALNSIPASPVAPIGTSDETPDVIMLMSESLWDPTRLPGVTLSPDPMPNMRANQSGHIFSPEFGGMTANVEFEALTGFSNAFLPYGSIPYQQYIHQDIPSLATFFRSQGYTARALHPFSGWFWNRDNVYSKFGFEEFRTEATMPPMEKRGIFASDDSLLKEIMTQADGENKPFFFFAVTLQGHGPYEPNRYVRNSIDVKGNMQEASRATLATYAQGVKEADSSLKMMMDWASKRKRETVIVLWGDHLPPLGSVYTDTGYMPDQVATRRASISTMKQEHETPLVIWSSKKGTLKDIGTISPALLPYHVLKFSGFEHPFYTDFLGKVEKNYAIIDRYQLVSHSDEATPDWVLKEKQLDPLIRDYRYLQHDIMFGKQRSLQKFFPQPGQVVSSLSH